MGKFTDAEVEFLTTQRLLARIATVGPDGMPHIAPVGWSLDRTRDEIVVGGRNLAATKKFRDVQRTGVAAIVIDHVLPPWRPQGVEVRGSAKAVEGPDQVIRIVPERIIGWGLEPDGGRQFARDV